MNRWVWPRGAFRQNAEVVLSRTTSPRGGPYYQDSESTSVCAPVAASLPFLSLTAGAQQARKRSYLINITTLFTRTTGEKWLKKRTEPRRQTYVSRSKTLYLKC